MSHITDIESTCVISDVAALEMAVKAFCPDLELVKNQKHYRTWKDNHNGKLVGDWKLPTGMTAEEVGENAKHVIRFTDEALKKKGQTRSDMNSPYEIGLVPVTVTRDKEGNVENVKVDPQGKEYALMTDFWNQGNGVMQAEGVGRHKTERNPNTGKTEDRSFEDLYMFYRMCEAKRAAQKMGDNIHFDKQRDGTYIAKVETQQRLGR